MTRNENFDAAGSVNDSGVLTFGSANNEIDVNADGVYYIEFQYAFSGNEISSGTNHIANIRVNGAVNTKYHQSAAGSYLTCGVMSKTRAMNSGDSVAGSVKHQEGSDAVLASQQRRTYLTVVRVQ
jgi:hypothetical protein